MSFSSFPHQKQRKYVKLWITLCVVFIKDSFVKLFKGRIVQLFERQFLKTFIYEGLLGNMTFLY